MSRILSEIQRSATSARIEARSGDVVILVRSGERWVWVVFRRATVVVRMLRVAEKRVGGR